jgi:GT2 family glycosyltransferase
MSEHVLSFVIPVRDDAARLARCLESIHAGTPPGTNVEIVVADNGSTDNSADVARQAGATVLDLPGMRLGELRNRAAQSSRGDVIAFVDADHEIGDLWIGSAFKWFDQPSIGAVGAPCHPPSPGTWVQRAYDRLRRHPRSPEPVSWLGSGNMAVRRAAFESVGGFDTKLETCEDVDLCRKLRAAGYEIFADRRMKNVHHGDPRTLGQVFFGELWRGRDNIRVSLRPPWSGRTLVSAALPVLNLLAFVAVIIGLITATPTGWWVAAVAGIYVVAAVCLRASVMTRRGGMTEWPAACAVAAAYEAGRACSITGRFGYRRRRREATAVGAP